MTIDVDCYEQSDSLFLIKIDGLGVIGYAADFDSCKTDVADACTADDAHRAKWFAWNDEWNWRSTTLAKIKTLKLEKYLIGTKKGMKLQTPMESL